MSKDQLFADNFENFNLVMPRTAGDEAAEAVVETVPQSRYQQFVSPDTLPGYPVTSSAAYVERDREALNATPRREAVGQKLSQVAKPDLPPVDPTNIAHS